MKIDILQTACITVPRLTPRPYRLAGATGPPYRARSPIYSPFSLDPKKISPGVPLGRTLFSLNFTISRGPAQTNLETYTAGIRTTSTMHVLPLFHPKTPLRAKLKICIFRVNYPHIAAKCPFITHSREKCHSSKGPNHRSQAPPRPCRRLGTSAPCRGAPSPIYSPFFT